MGGGGFEGGVCGAVPHSSSSLIDSHHPFFLPSPVRQGDGSGSGDSGSTAEGGSGACVFGPRVFQSHVCSHQGVGGLEAYHRPLSSKQFRSQDQVQDGDHPVGPPVSSQERLDGLNRSEGCVPSDPDSPSKQEVSSLCSRRRDLAVQVSLFRSDNGATGVYSGDGPGFDLSPSSRYQSSEIPGRLVNSSRVFGQSSLGEGPDVSSLRGARYRCESSEVAPDSISGGGLSGGQDRLEDFPGFADTLEDRKVLLNSRRISILKASVCEVLGSPLGSPGLPDPSCSRRSATDEVTPVDPQTELGLRGRGGSGMLGRLFSGRSSVVVRRGSSREGDVSGAPYSRPDVVVRRLRSGMGSHLRRPLRFRSMVPCRDTPINQFKRIIGSGEGSARTETFPPGGSDCRLFRQHDGNIVSSETGGNLSRLSERSGSEGSSLVRDSEFNIVPSVRDGSQQCGSRCPVQTGPDSGIGMDSPSGGVQHGSEEVASCDRSFRHLTFSPLFTIFRSNVGPNGSGNRRDVTAMGRSSGLRLSSFCHDKTSPKQDYDVLEFDSHPDSSVLASKGVVSGSSLSASRTSTSSPRTLGPVEATPRSEVPSEVVHASTSCVETLERFARASGFSSRVARRLGKARRKSSLRAYQSKWSVFRRWCFDKGHSVSRPSIPKVAEFLLWLWSSKGLGLSAIKGYRSMLSAVFGLRLPEISDSRVLRDLLRSFAIEKPRSVSQSPSWDLDLVLRSLMSEEYEPLESQTLRTLTKKVLFLVALATAKRVGELQGLSNVVSSQGNDLVVSYLPFFLAKTESCLNPLPRSFVIKSLADFAFGLEEGSLLCPVRALRIYLKRTKGLSRHSSGLFVSPRCPTRTISKNAISFFLREVISGAGAIRDSEGQSLRAHSIRGISASAAFMKNQSISKVLEAATWRSNSVFSSFYFKDISFSLGEWSSLGPFVAAGSVVSP